MADEDTAPKPQTQEPNTSAAGAETAPELTPPQNDPPPSIAPAPEERTELLQRARAFLSSPQVRHEDLTAKRRFLGEKGLSEDEIESLLREVVRPVVAHWIHCKFLNGVLLEARTPAITSGKDIPTTTAFTLTASTPRLFARPHLDCRRLRRAPTRLFRTCTLFHIPLSAHALNRTVAVHIPQDCTDIPSPPLLAHAAQSLARASHRLATRSQSHTAVYIRGPATTRTSPRTCQVQGLPNARQACRSE